MALRVDDVHLCPAGVTAVTAGASGGLFSLQREGLGDLDHHHPDGMAHLLSEYARHLKRRHLADSTIKRYTDDIRAFERHLDGTPHAQVSAEMIEDFLDGRALDSPRSRYRWLSELHRFYTWAVAHDHLRVDPTLVIDRPRLSRLLPRPVDDAVLALAMKVAGGQMRAWLALAAYAGLRCGEIALLDRASIGPASLRVKGKGSHERVVPMHPVVRDCLDRTHLARTGPVFRREGGQPYTPKEVSRRGALFHEMIGYPGVTFHQYRHNFGTRIYKHSKDLRATQELLGHARIDTTAGYAAVGAEDLAAAVAALPELE